MKVLVTGGAGFVGSHLVDALLASDHDVVVVDDLSTGRVQNLADARSRGLADEDVKRLDIADSSAADLVRAYRPEVIMLIGAQMSVKVSMRDPLLDARSNIVGLVNLMEAAVVAGTSRVVFASSGGTVYGEPPPNNPMLDETARGEPASFYGLTKFAGGEYLRLYRRHRGVEYVALALGNVYGPRQDPGGEAGVVTIFANRLLHGDECTINGSGAITRDYVYVSDVVDAFVRAATRGSGLINLGTGVETSVSAVYRTVARHVGTSLPPRYGPGLSGEVRRVCLNPARASRQLGWHPTVAFDDGVGRMVAHLRASAMPAPGR